MLDIIGTSLGLLYLYLELKENILMWIVGAIMPAIYIVVLFQAGIYADCAMEVYYFLAGLYGFFYWWKGKGKDKKPLVISHAPAKLLLLLGAITSVLWLAVWAFLHFLTDSRVPVIDALTTSLSIVALWMLSRKYIEQWWVWFVVDIFSSALYIYKGIYGRAFLYAIYTAMAVYGYFVWRKRMKAVTLQ